jgi:molybdopterin synthase catalytic subunit
MTIALVRRRLSVGAAYRELADAGSGGVVLFAGRVRPDPAPGGAISALRYEADVAMARTSLERLEREARSRFGARRVVLWHRLGLLSVGEISVLVGVATPHRREAFAAARYLIDALKRVSPIWKTEPGRSSRRRPAPRARRPGR